MGTMDQHTRQILGSAIALLVLHIATATPAKPGSTSPVYEVVNEQARIDQDIRQSTAILPYGNPLAGNSQKNARLHAQNQQAMFNAERIRQHRAQLQRWAQIPHLDSYMRAYHDSQETHQLALEKQQSLDILAPREQKKVHSESKVRRLNSRPEILKKGVRVIPEIEKITKTDAGIKTEKNRNHRSYGSVEHQQYLQPKMYKTVYLSPAPTYDQGVTIKPNGNVGLSGRHMQGEGNKLFTEAVPSKTQYQYVYPKQYSQMQGYESAQEISTLNSLLKKNPQEQLSELNALINQSKGTGESNKNVLETPIDLYFYMKDPPAQKLLQHYDQVLYNQEQPPTYASAYTQSAKDYTPITEYIDDVEDPNKNPKLQTYEVQAVLTTQEPEVVPIETTTTKSNNYYKVEVASQTISSGPNPRARFQYHVNGHDDKQELQYSQPLKQYIKKEETEGDESERYLHHNAQHKGVQHLSEDGTGVSAYDDDLHYAANYEFGYRVRDHHSGNDFGHHEAMSEGHTRGHYHVLLPDGRMQKVRYSAGPGGFHADISYDHLH